MRAVTARRSRNARWRWITGPLSPLNFGFTWRLSYRLFSCLPRVSLRRSAAGAIDVRDLIRRHSVEELNESADRYFQSLRGNPALVRKPFALPEVQHLLPEFALLVYGLRLAPGDRVLEFGCGTGWAARLLNLMGCEVVGADVSETAVEMARDAATAWRQALGLGTDHPALEFLRYDGHRLPLPDGSVDRVFVLDAFHHVPDQESTLREFSRVLRPGGIAGMCEPGPQHSRSTESQREMRVNVVIENDVVPAQVRAAALRAGFASMAVAITPLLPEIVPFEDYERFPRGETGPRFVAATEQRIRNYPIMFLYKPGRTPPDSRRNEGLCAEIDLVSPASLTLGPEDVASVVLRVRNSGEATWHRSGDAPGSVNIGLEIQGAAGCLQCRSHLSSSGVQPGAVVVTRVDFPALAPGEYQATLGLVAEHVAWFADLGSPSVRVRIEQRGA
jgi:ubiquinone/menaquinone biosynthesis C-methylase UbiE